MARVKKILVIFSAMLFLVQNMAAAKSDENFIVFTQVTSEGKTLYVADQDGSNLRAVVSGKNLSVFPENKHFLYFTDGRLFEYNLKQGTSKLLAKFEEETIQVNLAAEGPDQALIVGMSPYEINYYVLDFTDNNLRRVPPRSSSFQSGFVQKLIVNSPDGQNRAILKPASKNRFELSVETKGGSWVLPKDMSVLPESPQWSPDSQRLAFYAKPFNGYEGFYSLYVLELTGNKFKLRQIQEEVFSRFFFSNLNSGGFKPCWSKDSNHLVFSYLPFGVPSQSSIIKYDFNRNKKEIVLTSPSENYYPKLATVPDQILFLSNREGKQFQLYLVMGKERNLKRVSPAKGFTEWADWYIRE